MEIVSKQVLIMKLQHDTWQWKSCPLGSPIKLWFEGVLGLRTSRDGSVAVPTPSNPPVPSLAAPHPPIPSLSASSSPCSLPCCPHAPVPSLAAPILLLPPLPSLGASNTAIQKCCKLIYILHISLLPIGDSCSKEMLT